MKLFTIVRSEQRYHVVADYQVPCYRYAVKQVCDDDETLHDSGAGKLAMVMLSGISGKNDPLRNIRNAELLIGEDSQVNAINIDGDCVIRVSWLLLPISISMDDVINRNELFTYE